PGLDEAQLVVLLTRADRRLEPEFLAASGEVGRIEQVEVSLRHAHVAEKLIDRAEAGAKIKIARRPFFNVHDQIFQVRHFRRLHAHLDFALGRGEILQTFQTLLAQLDANHVEHFARRHGQFAPDDFVFRLGVAPDFNLLDFRRLAFINLVNQVHRAPVSVGVFDGPDHNPVPLTFANVTVGRSEEHTSELQSRFDLVCRLLLEKKKEKLNNKIFSRRQRERWEEIANYRDDEGDQEIQTEPKCKHKSCETHQ